MKMSWSLADDVVVVVVAVVVGRGGRGVGGGELVEPPGQDGDCNNQPLANMMETWPLMMITRAARSPSSVGDKGVGGRDREGSGRRDTWTM